MEHKSEQMNSDTNRHILSPNLDYVNAVRYTPDGGMSVFGTITADFVTGSGTETPSVSSSVHSEKEMAAASATVDRLLTVSLSYQVGTQRKCRAISSGQA